MPHKYPKPPTGSSDRGMVQNGINAAADLIQGPIDLVGKVGGDVLNVVPDAAGRMLRGDVVGGAHGLVSTVAKDVVALPGEIVNIPVRAAKTLMGQK
ncbi:hypothetical protein CDD83_8827 [Cordyceps sp. RAO-2017]|nr:hypothetical protein CDD83_8827 [Cordyceps sp. RAO-2017]